MELHGGNTALPRHHKNKKVNKHFQMKKKKSSATHGLPVFELLPSAVLQTPANITCYSIALGCPPEFGGKTMLLKTPHT